MCEQTGARTGVVAGRDAPRALSNISRTLYTLSATHLVTSSISQITELMRYVWPSANERFAFGITYVESRRIPNKLAWPTWNYESVKLGIMDRP